MAIAGRVCITLLFTCALLHGAAAINPVYYVGGIGGWAGWGWGGWVLQSKNSTLYEDQFKYALLQINSTLLFSPLNSTIGAVMIPEDHVATCDNSTVIGRLPIFVGSTTGSAGFILDTPGTFGIICDISDYCTNHGMHFKVTVAAPAPTSAPIAPSAGGAKPDKASVLQSGSAMLVAVLAGGAVLLL